MKLYVLVRKDLGSSYSAVQAGHAVAEFLLQYPNTWKNETLIYLGVTEQQLNRWICELKYSKIEHVIFREPDIGNQITAVAVLNEGKIFKKLKLL